jgi:multiple sugar transport system substrate-binding protein
VALESAGPDAVIRPFIEQFSAKTGIPVTTEAMLSQTIYSKTNIDLVSQGGAYDIVMVETAWVNDWAPWLWTWKDMAERFDPQGYAGLQADWAGQYAGILRANSDMNRNVKSVSYMGFQQGLFYRQDVFEDAGEKAAFKTKYGYDLAPPTTQGQMLDQADFFTRPAGATLMGKPLAQQLYGVSVMAGIYDIAQEMFTIIYGAGGSQMRIIRNPDGTVKEFLITKADTAIMVESVKYYKELVAHSSPGAVTSFWDFCATQFTNGLCIILPDMYSCIDQMCWQVSDNIPGAKMGIAQCVGGQGYPGTWSNGIPLVTKNPEAAYWLTRYLTCYDTVNVMANQGWTGVRHDVDTAPENQGPVDYTKGSKWRLITARGQFHNLQLEYTKDMIDGYMQFNNPAQGRIMEQAMIIWHDGAIGVKSPEETVDWLNTKALELGRKFSDVPHRMELDNEVDVPVAS